MAAEDNFDIDIYGDESNDFTEANQQSDVKQDDAIMHTDSQLADSTDTIGEVKAGPTDEAAELDSGVPSGVVNGDAHHDNGTQQIASTGGSANALALHKQAPRQQGMKRKQGDDDERPTDPGATAALMLNDLNWWIGEEDIRGWANQSGCEDELVDITFNEHKVNGKSKGQIYVQLQTPQAATALKHQVDTIYKDQAHAKKPTAVFNPPHINPFKTLPKDVPAREKNTRGDRAVSSSYSGHQNSNQGGNYNRFNNNRGNFNNRGANNNNMNFQNRNFGGPVGGNMGGGMGGYGSPAPMNNFGATPMGGMNNFGGGGFSRGGMMAGGMRGGMQNRGGRGGNMGMNNMGAMNMPMGGNMMGMGGGMMGMGGNLGMMGGLGNSGGFGGAQPHFNPAFFNQAQQQQQQQQQGSDGNWNPHGAKRPRPE
ncbi:hypothetical protein K504DRAFT_274505 [Pleomassaria siparia CBS 279.74]|uniref:RRM domain-containing protein n=1 Tax=Pleomassaria siparia CBS 279.74 TaxID=1314801 RepID=A0A6G1KA01_9PLEO|nr:hypothetical protein K504DRAFT_274505 [Pleomassaria siparia CBS 279.74]